MSRPSTQRRGQKGGEAKMGVVTKVSFLKKGLEDPKGGEGAEKPEWTENHKTKVEKQQLGGGGYRGV